MLAARLVEQPWIVLPWAVVGVGAWHIYNAHFADYAALSHSLSSELCSRFCRFGSLGGGGLISNVDLNAPALSKREQ